MLRRLTLLLPTLALTLGCSDADETPMVQPPQARAQEQASTQQASAPAPVQASAVDPQTAQTLADWVRNARSGSLILRAHDGGTSKVSAGPGLGTEISVEITGMIARTTVRQKFSNPSDAWVEGIYVFPLADDAAVDHMRILTDGRVIEGQIQEKEEARKTYEAAKAEGKRAGLVEQERPNVFTTSIANIRPGSEVTVEIEYQQSVRLDHGELSLRVPTIVAPRHLPGQTEGESEAPSTPAPTNPFEIEIDLAPGFEVETLASPYHPITIDDDGHSYKVALAEGPVPADRDFVLQWKPMPGEESEAVVYTETWGADTYALMMVTPPFETEAHLARVPREVIYVVDTSGSMAGASMIQAKDALAFGLRRLTPEDRFNVIEFNNETSAFFDESREAHAANVEEALDQVAGLQASGGTDIAPAILRALQDDVLSKSELRQVVFLTDGSVGNEVSLLEEIEQQLGESRVFAIGIGPAPNSFFMRKLAQLGRGSFTHIGDPSEVSEKMTTLLRKLESAVLAGITIELPEGTDIEMYPYEVPDLYAGEPVVVVMKLDAPLGQVSARGWTADSPWQVDIESWGAEDRAGIHVLWARQAIEERMDDRLGTRDEKILQELRGEATALALEHHLVSAFTSLVAVDVTPERYADTALEPHQLGANLPPGWQPDSVGFAKGATPAALHILIGLAFLATSWAWRRVSA